jgi:hypothetical protein
MVTVTEIPPGGNLGVMVTVTEIGIGQRFGAFEFWGIKARRLKDSKF